jgi:adenylate kinase family enzyme/GNAT superfamily N-acetyltransferase
VMTSDLVFKEMTEDLFLSMKKQIDVEDLSKYISNVRPDLDSVLHWSYFEIFEKFAGCFWLYSKGGDVYFGMFLVEEFRGKDIGGFCLEHILSLATTKKIEELFLNVRANNHRAIRFYEKHGFIYREMKKKETGVEYIKMSKKLVPKRTSRYNRILICGISGAGKTTLAKKLAEEYGHKPLYLDQYFWMENWTQRPLNEFFSLLDQEIEKDTWILEGALLKIVRRYVGRADLVIWLRPSRSVAIFRVLKRVFLNYGNVREEFAPGCYEKIDFEFLKWIWNYPKNKHHELAKIFKDNNVKYIEIKSVRDLSRILEEGR